MRWHTVVAILTLSQILLLPAYSTAWETDVHLGLTRWLAEKAGFSPSQAEEIAWGDQGVDDEWATAPVWLGIQVIFSNSEIASKTLSENHFPTASQIPGSPESRPVGANTSAAKKRVNEELKIPYARKPGRALRNLGAALHAFQDSWSHAGIPDVPVRPLKEISPEFAWSHPVNTGGWHSHDADLTSFHDKTVAMEMARESYAVLRDYRKKNFQDQEPVYDWPGIEKDVSQFVEASTKDKKYKWFLGQNFSHRDAANSSDYLSLPGPNPGRVETQQNAKTPETPRPRSVQYSQNSLVDFAEKFLNTWIVEGNVSAAAADKFIDYGELGPELALLGYDGVITDRLMSTSRARQWAEGFLLMWLLADHSLANKAHHGMDFERGKALFEKPFTDTEVPKMQFPSLEEAIEWKGSERYQIIPLDKDKSPFELGKSNAVVFRFIHTPKDAVILIMKLSHYGWEITHMFSIVAG